LLLLSISSRALRLQGEKGRQARHYEEWRKKIMDVKPYVCFEGRCEEAIEFYKEALGAEVMMMMRFSQAPGGEVGSESCAGSFNPEEVKDKIMHASLKFGDSEVMMSDGMNSGQSEFKGITLTLSVGNDEEAKKKFHAVCQGGQIHMDIHQTFFASSFGVGQDRFGVNWMVLAPLPVPAHN
jgi:PhnB protein